MQYFLLHGEDSIKSYDRLLKFIDKAKKRDWEIVYLDDSSSNLRENVSAASLFTTNRFFIHRNFKKITAGDLEWISNKSNGYEGNLVMYADSEVPKTSISKLPKGIKIEEFKLSKLIWRLVESFYPGNVKNFLTLLHNTTKTEPIELIFELIARQVRDLYIVKSNLRSSYMPDWKAGKLKSQASRFTTPELNNIISELAEADVKSKSSNANLIDLLDFIVLEKLQ